MVAGSEAVQCAQEAWEEAAVGATVQPLTRVTLEEAWAQGAEGGSTETRLPFSQQIHPIISCGFIPGRWG